jgi:hypothetical protein
MARKITLKQAIREMREAREIAAPLAAMADPDRPFMCIDCNDETPIGCAVCRDESVEICESFYEEPPAKETEEPPAEETEQEYPLLREERFSETEQAHSLLRENAFPPARDEPARESARSPRPPFMEPEPLSPRAIKRAERAAAYARWYRGNGWTGPSVRFAREDADDF